MPHKSNTWQKGSKDKGKVVACILGFIIIVVGIIYGMLWQDIFDYIMAKEMVLRPYSRLYDNWKTPPMDISLDIYFFNWTNPEDFRNLSRKPIMKQLGPYRFTERPDKVNITWHPHNASVTYRRKSDFYFDAEGSKGSLEDEIVTLNAVALSAASTAKKWNQVRRSMVDVGLRMYGQELHVMKTADELLFTGYSDDMIDIARAMPVFGKDVTVPFDRFGWFYTRNGSADLTGVFNVYTGVDDPSKTGQMHTWNYKKHTGFFDSYCGLTNGSAGEFQPPNLQVNSTVYLFTPDMCRSLPLDYVETAEVEGVLGYKFAGGDRSVDNGTLYPENLCFCGGKCVASGVMNISACRFGSPVFMSYPHFYNADASYVQQVEGLEPNATDHEFYMILEPSTGLPLEVVARFQVNMLVEPIQGISLYEHISSTFLPLIWFEQKVRITPDLAFNLKVLPYVLYGGQLLACFCTAVGLLMFSYYPLSQLWARRSAMRYSMNAHTKPAKSAPEKPTPSPTSSRATAADETAMQVSGIVKFTQLTPPSAVRIRMLDSSPLLEKTLASLSHIMQPSSDAQQPAKFAASKMRSASNSSSSDTCVENVAAPPTEAQDLNKGKE